jgi:hypothetical protein
VSSSPGPVDPVEPWVDAARVAAPARARFIATASRESPTPRPGRSLTARESPPDGDRKALMVMAKLAIDHRPEGTFNVNALVDASRESTSRGWDAARVADHGHGILQTQGAEECLTSA